MHKVSIYREIPFSSKAVWRILDDFGSIYLYNPAVKTSKIIGEIPTGIGAQRICYFHDGTSLREKITKYYPGKGYEFELSEFSLPLKTASTEISITSKDHHKSSINITICFSPKFGPLGWLMAKILMKPMLTKALNALAKGLEDHMKSGLPIGAKGELLLSGHQK